MAFELIKERRGGVLVLQPQGRLDNDNAAEFELAAQELLNAGERHIVVDLAQLNYTSNAGLRVLGKMNKALKGPTTSLRVCGLTPNLRQVFDAAGISMVFDIRTDLEAALADHPAARGAGELGREAARLLGLPPAAQTDEPIPEPIRNLAALAAELMAGQGSGSAPRARKMVDATQLVPRVRPADVQRALAAQAVAPKAGFWQRLFGKKP